MIKRLWIAWDHFWFGPQNLIGLAFMRVVLCGTMFYMYIIRLGNLSYYSDSNWVPRAKAFAAFSELYQPSFLWCFWPDSWMGVMHVLLVALLGLLTLGIGGRWLMWAAWILDMGFIQRNYSVNFGADIIASLLLFYMCFTESCERLSILNIFRDKRSLSKSDILSSLMIRMMQVQISVLYAYTGWEKLKGASWWDGTALWSVMANPQMTTMNYDFLRHIPWIMPIMGYATILFETYFPVMIVWNKTRTFWLIAGVFFHCGIGLFMGLGNFALVMLSTYFLFIDPSIMEQKIVSKWENRKESFLKPSRSCNLENVGDCR